MKESFLYIFLHYSSELVEDKDGFYSFRVIYGASIGDHKIRDYVTGSSVHHSTSNDSIREYRLYNSEKLISIDSLFDPSNKFVDSEGKLKIEMKVKFLKYLISGVSPTGAEFPQVNLFNVLNFLVLYQPLESN